jgi:vacuolar iron transporter family protein
MSVLERWHEEKQSAWIYRNLVGIEKDPARVRMFEGLSDAAEAQADILRGDAKVQGLETPRFEPSLRAIVVVAIVRRVGIRRSTTMLAALKVRGLAAYIGKDVAPGHVMPKSTSEIGEKHRNRGSGGTLRAAVFGVNDGLVSNTSLILGLAGAASEPKVILMTGIAGLLAGAFSMASGEYVSMRSQRELFEYQLAEEREELARYPDEEAEELALIYAARGVPIEQARAMTKEMVKDPVRALDTLAREELGLNPDDLGSPWGAAIYSLLAFSAGAIVPLIPFFFTAARHKVLFASGLAGVCLFGVGATLSLFSGKNAWLGGLRMLFIGGAAGAATFGIGKWLGVAMS